MRNYGTGLTPVVAIRPRTIEYPALSPTSATRHPLPHFQRLRRFRSTDTWSGVSQTTPPQYWIMADNRCAGPLATSPPTTSSWCTKSLSSMHARSTVLCPTSRPTLRVQGVACRGEAPSGFRTVGPVTCSEMRYELNCGLSALFDSSTNAAPQCAR